MQDDQRRERRSYRDLTNMQSFPGEYNPDPSMTIPDQTMPLPELLARFARGQSISGRLDAYFSPNEGIDEFPDLRSLDLAEIEQLRRDNQETIDRLRNTPKTQIPDYGSAGAVQNPKPAKQDGEARPGASPAGGALSTIE